MTPSLATSILWAFWALITPFIFMIPNHLMIEWTILQISTSPITVPILLDQTSLLFSSSVLFISANVMNFSKTYMMDDKTLPRFTILVLLFVLSMNLLIFIPHLIALLMGWDGLGLVSFLLVIYYQNPKSLGAGMITVLSNRVGDALILLSIGWCLNQGHWSITMMSPTNMDTAITLAIMVAAMTKSAQLPFSSWLPAAMAAPTPVSALVHSSTLVTAGVFLLIRFSPFLMKSPIFQPALLLIGTMTMLMAGYSAMAECDMKKIIALSTLSQLGLMMSSIGIGSKEMALFHLLTHAMFKALLFICAGMIIHNHSHSQDLRTMGNIWSQMPLTTTSLMIANLALCGSPFLSGFYSKDLIIEHILFNPNNIIIILMFLFATLLTTLYSLRFMLAVLWSPIQNTPMIYTNDTDWNSMIPMFLLSLNAIILGASLNWTLMTPTTHPILTPLWKTAPITLCLLLIILTWQSQTQPYITPSPLIYKKSLHLNMTSMWQMTPISSQKIPLPILTAANASMKQTDNGWMETLGPQGAHYLTSLTSSKFLQLQSLPITTTMMSIFLTLIILLLIM